MELHYLDNPEIYCIDKTENLSIYCFGELKLSRFHYLDYQAIKQK
jgi:hypothetical protein